MEWWNYKYGLYVYSIENVIKRHDNIKLRVAFVRELMFYSGLSFDSNWTTGCYFIQAHYFLHNAIESLSSLRPSITMWSLLRLCWTGIWPRPNPRSGANLERIFDFWVLVCVFLSVKKSYSQGGQIKADYRQPEAIPPHCEPIQLCSLRRSLSLFQERANLGCKNISRPIYFFLSFICSLPLFPFFTF